MLMPHRLMITKGDGGRPKLYPGNIKKKAVQVRVVSSAAPSIKIYWVIFMTPISIKY